MGSFPPRRGFGVLARTIFYEQLDILFHTSKRIDALRGCSGPVRPRDPASSTASIMTPSWPLILTDAATNVGLLHCSTLLYQWRCCCFPERWLWLNSTLYVTTGQLHSGLKRCLCSVYSHSCSSCSARTSDDRQLYEVRINHDHLHVAYHR